MTNKYEQSVQRAVKHFAGQEPEASDILWFWRHDGKPGLVYMRADLDTQIKDKYVDDVRAAMAEVSRDSR